MVRSDLVIAGSNFIFDHIQKNYAELLTPRKRILVIFRGINTEYFSNSTINNEKLNKASSDLNLSSETFKILLPGRLTKWKGQEMFLESLSLLRVKYGKENFQSIILRGTKAEKCISKKISFFG